MQSDISKNIQNNYFLHYFFPNTVWVIFFMHASDHIIISAIIGVWSQLMVNNNFPKK